MVSLLQYGLRVDLELNDKLIYILALKFYNAVVTCKGTRFAMRIDQTVIFKIKSQYYLFVSLFCFRF